jgi:hypothetical protein
MKRVMTFLAAAALVAALAHAAGPQEKKAADKYAALCGSYRFDLTSSGLSVITVKVYAEADGIYVLADTSDSPDKISPFEASDTKFFLDDPDEGHWDFEFIKDDKGKFSKCRIVNAGLGIDSTGDRIDG